MADTGIVVRATAGQRDFDVPFPYLDVSHVKADVRGSPALFQWISPTRLRLLTPAGAGDAVRIYRQTPISKALVNFQAGATLTEADLNTAVRQTLFIQQELMDLYTGSLEKAKVTLGENLGIVTTPDDLLAELVNMTLADEVLAEFRQRIADIDLNAEAVIKVGLRTDALQTAVNALASLEDGTGIATVIQQEKDERIEGDTALASTLALIGAKSADSLAFILDTNKVRVSPTESLAARMQSLGSQIGQNLALIQAEQQTRLTKDEALSTRLDTQGVRLDASEAAMVEERRVRASADAAEALARTQLAAKIAGDISGAIQNEASIRAAADGVFVSQFALLGAKTPNGQAWALDETKVQVAGGKSLGQRLSGIDTQVGLVSASVVEERKAWSTATNSLSQRIDGVVSTVGSHTTSITQLFEARDGLYARAGLAIDNNGYVTGWTLNNDGRSGSFTVFADQFRIVTPGSAPQVPFSVVGNRIRMNANVDLYGDLFVDGTINGRKFTMDTVTSTQVVYDGTTIVLNGTAPIRIQGVWLNVEKASSPIDLDFNAWATFTHNASGSFIAYAQLVRSRGTEGGTILCTVPIFGSGMANDTWQGAVPIKYLDRPNETGNWHYYVQMFTNVNNMTTQSVTARYGKATEMKTNTTSLSLGTGRGPGSGTGGGSGSGGGGVIDPGGGGGIGGGGGGTDQPVIT